MDERFRVIPLTIDNILSFEDYIPQMIQHRILLDSVTGWGVIEEDVVSGVAMVELLTDTSIVSVAGQEEKQLRILWLYVDDEVRRQGIGKELMSRCRTFAEENGAMGLYCRYPVENFGETDDFLISCGFYVASDGREELVEVFSDSEFEPAMSVHTAWLRIKGQAQNADRQFLAHTTDMGLVMPRLTSISLYLEEMDYSDFRLTEDDHGRMMLVVSRDGDLCDIMISVLPDDLGDSERYRVILRGKQPYNEKKDVTAHYLSRWQKSHLMTVGEIREEENCVEFTAMIQVDKGAVEEERFRDFFTAVCKDIDSFK